MQLLQLQIHRKFFLQIPHILWFFKNNIHYVIFCSNSWSGKWLIIFLTVHCTNQEKVAQEMWSCLHITTHYYGAPDQT